MDIITVIYSGGLPEIRIEEPYGIKITRDEPVALPRPLAEHLLKTRPGEFKKVEGLNVD